MRNELIAWLALGPPYLAVFAAAYGWIKSKKLRQKVNWNKAATLLSSMIADKEQDHGLGSDDE